jgi:cytochrome c peroxidase
MEYDDNGELIDPGRARITGDDADLGAFLTPMLRSVVLTSPYFHDGSEVVLRDAVRYHSSPEARMDPNYDPLLDLVPELTDTELDDVVAFLRALRGESVPMEYQSILPPLP